MLRSLSVRNFAIVDELDVELYAGMTVLTGETGAGKSILVDALGLLLGDRGGSGLVREGATRAELAADFDVDSHAAASDWLREHELDADGDCLLRRVIGSDGRSRAFVNGNPVPLQSLKAIGELLADIHGQHFHQSLGKAAVQRDLLDHYAGNAELRQTVAERYDALAAARGALEALEAAEADRASNIDLLKFQVQELEALDLGEGELAELERERQKLKNVSQLAGGLADVLRDVDEGEGSNARQLVTRAAQELSSLSALDDTLEPAMRLLDEAAIQLDEAIDVVRRYVDSLDADPKRIDWVEERLNTVRMLARKHQIPESELGEQTETLRQRLDDLLNAGQRADEMRQSVASAEDDYRKDVETLSERRVAAANRLSAAVTTAMNGLGMPGGEFAANVDALGGDAARHGADRIEYLIGANPGQPLMPLAKVASGGELSRMSLAIQVIVSDGSTIPTMVFDEVDSGVGGGVAEMVGRRLQELGASRQVLCVTHLPQVASQADQHLRISKVSDGKSTRSGVQQLDETERLDELARMLGGVEITQRTRDHAAEMLATGRRVPDESQVAG